MQQAKIPKSAQKLARGLEHNGVQRFTNDKSMNSPTQCLLSSLFFPEGASPSQTLCPLRRYSHTMHFDPAWLNVTRDYHSLMIPPSPSYRLRAWRKKNNQTTQRYRCRTLGGASGVESGCEEGEIYVTCVAFETSIIKRILVTAVSILIQADLRADSDNN